jgi:hypothetical protein
VAQVISDLTEHARSADVDQLLTEAGRALDARRLGLALNAFRRAAGASLGSENLRRRVFDKILDGAEAVTVADWRLAESMLSLAEGLDTHWRAPAQIWQPIERELCEEYVSNVLAEVSRSDPIENLPRFRGRLVHALHRYPGEPRLQKRLQLIDRALEAPAGTPAPIEIEAVVPEPSVVPVPVTEVAVPSSIPYPELKVREAGWSPAKGLGVAAAVLVVSGAAFFSARYGKMARVPDATAKTYVVLPEAKKDVAAATKAKTVVQRPVPAKVALPPDRKAMIASAPRLPAPKVTIETIDVAADEKLAQVQWNDRNLLQDLQQAERTLAEQSDWNAIDRGNQEALAGFLGRHPDGAFAGQARQAVAALKEKTALAELTRERAEEALAALHSREMAEASNAVTAMLQRYVDAWNAKDIASITALYRGLDRRTIKAQLAPVTTIRMTITPASAAQIEGERATIVCRRQVEETFSDGTEKQSPQLLVTFTLSKRDGEWSIEGTR